LPLFCTWLPHNWTLLLSVLFGLLIYLVALVTFLWLQYWSAWLIEVREHRKTCIYCVLSFVKPTKCPEIVLQLCNLNAMNSSASNAAKCYILFLPYFFLKYYTLKLHLTLVATVNSKRNCCISEHLHSWLCKWNNHIYATEHYRTVCHTM